MQMRRFDGSSDWHAPAAVDDVISAAPAGPMPILRRGALAFLALVAMLVLALSITVQANASTRNEGFGEELNELSASWSSGALLGDATAAPSANGLKIGVAHGVKRTPGLHIARRTNTGS